jgi:hypothetical protein
MNTTQKRVRASKMLSRNLALREQLWPNLNPQSLWNRTQKDGYTTIPRPMPRIMQIMDDLAPKGMPVSATYLSLWFRVFDESMIEIKNEKEMAAEAGFTGQRAVTTWHSRMKHLVEMGFIDAKEGLSGKYQYVLIFNPYLVIKGLKKKIPQQSFVALFARAQEVGADKDLK